MRLLAVVLTLDDSRPSTSSSAARFTPSASSFQIDSCVSFTKDLHAGHLINLLGSDFRWLIVTLSSRCPSTPVAFIVCTFEALMTSVWNQILTSQERFDCSRLSTT